MEKQYKSEEKKKTSLEQCQEKGQASGKKLEVKVSRELEQHEDAALKTAMREFAEVLLPYFGIEGKVVGYGPTESIHLEMKKLFEDFNLIMEDGTWKHFEFQSKNEGIEGLKRFRVYEAMASYQYKAAITTYVLYSGNILNPVTEFTEGENTFRVIPIIMRERDADLLISELKEKEEKGGMLTKEELVPLMFCSLMGGKMAQKDRMKAAFRLTQQATHVSEEEIRKIEEVLYAMADKFLEKEELGELVEEISMTKLGEMLVNKGVNQGIEQGIEALIESLKEMKVSKEEVTKKIQEKFLVSSKEADQYIQKYWK